MALTAKNMPYKHRFGPFAGEIYRMPMSYPLRDGGLTGAGRGCPRAGAGGEAGRRGQRRRHPDRADPGRGRVRGACARVPARAGAVVHRPTVRCSSPTRSRPGSAVPATGSPASTSRSCPTCHDREGHRRRAAAGRGHRSGRDHGRGARRAASAARTAATRSPARPALAAIETMRELDLCTAARRIESVMLPRLRELAAEHPEIGDVRGRGAMLAIELVDPDQPDGPTGPAPDAAADPGGGQGLPRGRAARAHLRHVRQRAPVPAAAGHRRRHPPPWTGSAQRRPWMSIGSGPTSRQRSCCRRR